MLYENQDYHHTSCSPPFFAVFSSAAGPCFFSNLLSAILSRGVHKSLPKKWEAIAKKMIAMTIKHHFQIETSILFFFSYVSFGHTKEEEEEEEEKD
uniref:Uncharacterized protein n=1 Tax=Noccaea caerulescens TaxID=107243 RepID=A0A1J3CGH0_NOCCA